MYQVARSLCCPLQMAESKQAVHIAGLNNDKVRPGILNQKGTDATDDITTHHLRCVVLEHVLGRSGLTLLAPPTQTAMRSLIARAIGQL